ncbi:hypothetical protein MLD38_010102 [Melastoma candidum]|uniref:Uncharacterized protein n=1 Tax=Melastoma candidum TaxID=119954 RepID=A0ACB9R2U4_9MYRT|nr:hypothetical protein MLD38_010102 [Melastoma candidum]
MTEQDWEELLRRMRRRNLASSPTRASLRRPGVSSTTVILTRVKAHDVIRRMLSSLGDPYTRFLSPDEVICTVGRDSQYQMTITADAAPLVTDPVILMELGCNEGFVNSKTACASEIVVSALHDNCKVVLVGKKQLARV